MANSKIHVNKLIVFLDTNAFHNNSGSELLRSDLTKLVKKHKGHINLKLQWYIPVPALEERKQQMLRTNIESLGSLRSLISLFGNAIDVNQAHISERVDRVAIEQLSKSGIKSCDLNFDDVNWVEVARRALVREPPFEESSDDAKEKGFRDALIGLACKQCLDKFPKNSKFYKYVLVSGDKRLRTYFCQLAGSHANVDVDDTLEALKGRINAILESVPETLIGELSKKAWDLVMVNSSEEDSPFQNIVKLIFEKYLAFIIVEIGDGSNRETKSVVLSPARFVKKSGREFYWSAVFHWSYILFHYEWREKYGPETGPMEGIANLAPTGGLLGGGLISSRVPGLSGIAQLLNRGEQHEQIKIVDKSATLRFEVTWKTRVDAKKNLHDAQICGVERLESGTQ